LMKEGKPMFLPLVAAASSFVATNLGESPLGDWS